MNKLRIQHILLVVFLFFGSSVFLFNSGCGANSGSPPVEATTTTTTTTTSTTSTTTLGDSAAPTFSGLSSATANSSGRVTLAWSAATDETTSASNIRYLIYQGTSAITSYSSSNYTTRETTYIATGLSASTAYHFVVRASDEAGNIDSNTTEKISTTESLRTAPTLIYPLNNAHNISSSLTFSWGSVTGATTYEIQTDDNQAFSSPTSTGTTSASATLTGLGSNSNYWRVRAGDSDNFGSWSLTREVIVGKPAGDFNNDGKSDVIVGAWRANGTQDSGEAWICYGSDSMGSPGLIVTGEALNNRLGTSVSSVGDIDGDGIDDVIVGGLNSTTGAWKVYLLVGGSTPNSVVDATISGSAGFASGKSVLAVASAGDVNNDGNDDIIIGTSLADGNGVDSGQAYIFLGGSSLSGSLTTTDASVTITGGAAGDQLGYSVASAGDVNNDGKDDIIIGANLADGNGTDSGQAYMFFGGSSLSGSLTSSNANVTISGGATGDQLGYSVSSAGDVNGDGFTDVIIGANLADGNGTDSGQAYVFFGSSGLSGSITSSNSNVIINGGLAGDEFGNSVASAGDVNEDGKGDIVVGAWKADGTVADQGKAYLFNSGASLTGTLSTSSANATVTGTTSSNFLGISISSAGSVDGDSTSDIIIGAYLAGGSSKGQAYIYLDSTLTGSLSTTNATATFTGSGSSDQLGFSVSGGRL